MVTARDDFRDSALRPESPALKVLDHRSALERRLDDAGLNLSTIALRAVDLALTEARSPRRLISTLSRAITNDLIAGFIATQLIREGDDRAACERAVRDRVIGLLAYRGLYDREEHSPEAMLALAIQHATTPEARERIRAFVDHHGA